jgi:hypothetical protein
VKVSITIDEGLLDWVCKKAGSDGTSLSELISRLIEREIRACQHDGLVPDSYWRAYEEWKKLDRDLGVPFDASKRFKRDEIYDRQD